MVEYSGKNSFYGCYPFLGIVSVLTMVLKCGIYICALETKFFEETWFLISD